MRIITCPSCGNADDLEGRHSAEGVEVECGSCGHTWLRDLTPTCTSCGSTNVVAVPTATLEEAGRGEQRTPSGIVDIYRCHDCGARDATSMSPQRDPDWERRPARFGHVPRWREDDQPSAGRAEGEDTRRVESAFGLFTPGQVVGRRWRLQHLMHWSSTGSLWLAHAEDGDQRVMFKLVHPRLTRDARRTALHARAAQAIVGIRHPHLVPVLDVKVQDGHVLIVTPALEGSVLDRDSRLDPTPLIGVARELANALAAMHGRKMPHLDVRPEKILLDSAGRARLVDLGSGRVRASQRTTVAGHDRRAFQAPEQIVSHEHKPSADVYALGLTLWVLAGGELQQLGVNTDAQASYRVTNNMPALDPAATGLPRHVTDAIAAATRRPPDQRPTAVELAQLLGGAESIRPARST